MGVCCRHIVIKPAKGEAVVVWSKSQYLEEIISQLNNSNFSALKESNLCAGLEECGVWQAIYCMQLDNTLLYEYVTQMFVVFTRT